MNKSRKYASLLLAWEKNNISIKSHNIAMLYQKQNSKFYVEIARTQTILYINDRGNINYKTCAYKK